MKHIFLIIITFLCFSLKGQTVKLNQLQTGSSKDQITVTNGKSNTLVFRNAKSYILDSLHIRDSIISLGGGGSVDVSDTPTIDLTKSSSIISGIVKTNSLDSTHLKVSGVIPGDYNLVRVNDKGIITAGSQGVYLYDANDGVTIDFKKYPDQPPGQITAEVDTNKIATQYDLSKVKSIDTIYGTSQYLSNTTKKIRAKSNLNIWFVGDSRTEQNYTPQRLRDLIADRNGSRGFGGFNVATYPSQMFNRTTTGTVLDNTTHADSSFARGAIALSSGQNIVLTPTTYMTEKYNKITVFYVGSITLSNNSGTSSGTATKVTALTLTTSENLLATTITATANDTRVFEIIYENTSKTGVLLHRFGNAGIKNKQVAETTTNYYQSVFSPDLSIIRLGVNGYGSEGDVEQRDSLQSIINHIGVGEFLIVGETDDDTHTPAFINNLNGLYSTMPYAYVDLMTVAGDWAKFYASGLGDPYIHENNLGAKIIADKIYKRIVGDEVKTNTVGIVKTGGDDQTLIAGNSNGIGYSGITTLSNPYSFASSGGTGYLRIDLPKKQSYGVVSIDLSVQGYDTDGSFKIYIAGFDDATFQNTSGYIVSSDHTVSTIPFLIGTENSKLSIWIGTSSTVWTFLGVNIDKLTVNLNSTSINNWTTGWKAAITTTAPTTTYKTFTNQKIVADAGAIKGKSVPTLATGFLKYDGTNLAWDNSVGGSGLTGSGTTGYLPYYSGASTLANSPFYRSAATRVNIGTIDDSNLLGRAGLNIMHSDPGFAIGKTTSRYNLFYFHNDTMSMYNSSFGDFMKFLPSGYLKYYRGIGTGDRGMYVDQNGIIRPANGPYAEMAITGSGYVTRGVSPNGIESTGLYCTANNGNNFGIGTTAPSSYGINSGGGIAIFSSDPRFALANNTRQWLHYLSTDSYKIWNDGQGDIFTFNSAGNISHRLFKYNISSSADASGLVGKGTDGNLKDVSVTLPLQLSTTGVLSEKMVKIDTVYTTSTWTKPAGATRVEVILKGGGGGGGSGGGAVFAASTYAFAYGGNGGWAGATSKEVYSSSELSSAIFVVIGAGGTGGAGKNLSNTAGEIQTGNNGTSGGDTWIYNGNLKHLIAKGGKYGEGGKAAYAQTPPPYYIQEDSTLNRGTHFNTSVGGHGGCANGTYIGGQQPTQPSFNILTSIGSHGGGGGGGCYLTNTGGTTMSQGGNGVDMTQLFRPDLVSQGQPAKFLGVYSNATGPSYSKAYNTSGGGGGIPSIDMGNTSPFRDGANGYTGNIAFGGGGGGGAGIIRPNDTSNGWVPANTGNTGAGGNGSAGVAIFITYFD